MANIRDHFNFLDDEDTKCGSSKKVRHKIGIARKIIQTPKPFRFYSENVERLIMEYIVGCDGAIDSRFYVSLLKGNNIFLTGIGGSGKTFNIIHAVDWLRRIGRRVAVTSSTGISAVGVHGQTVHRWSGLFGDKKYYTKRIDRVCAEPKYQHNWNSVDVLVIDEVSMIGSSYLDALDAIGRRIRSDSAPFGGLQIIMTGDFLQLPPINDGWAFESFVWRNMKMDVVELEKSYRCLDENFNQILRRVRMGDTTESDRKALDKRRIKKPISMKDIDGVILSSKRDFAKKTNDKRMASLQGAEARYQCEDYRRNINDKIAIKKLAPVLRHDTLFKGVAREVVLKVGAKVMITANKTVPLLSPNPSNPSVTEAEVVNGNVGIVVNLHDDVVDVDVDSIGLVGIAYNENYIEDDGDSDIVHCRSQIPLICAWALTTHKSQGATLDKVFIYLSSNEWCCEAMTYVALSRCRRLSDITILSRTRLPIYTAKKAARYYRQLDIETKKRLEAKKKRMPDTVKASLPPKESGQKHKEEKHEDKKQEEKQDQKQKKAKKKVKRVKRILHGKRKPDGKDSNI
jgi:ATP-dependent DNA helicase PIF1